MKKPLTIQKVLNFPFIECNLLNTVHYYIERFSAILQIPLFVPVILT